MRKELLADIRNPEDYLKIYAPRKIERNFAGKSIVSVNQFEREDLDLLYRHAERMRELVRTHTPMLPLMGYVLANLFYEPSTRTDLSFQAAMARLGGRFASASSGVEFSSVAKGESLADTVRAAACYADVVVLRHPQVGASYEAAHYLEKFAEKLGRRVPVISAGDGVGEHPTQGLLDLFTIFDEFGDVDGKTVAMVGDLKYGRTVHSLSQLLMKMNSISLILVSPEKLMMPQELTDKLRLPGMAVEETTDLMAIGQADVVYHTRVQKERFDDPEEYEAVRSLYIITPEILQSLKDGAIYMHPLPRVNEMGTPEQQDIIDDDPKSRHFHQMENGMYIRMALLAAVLGKV